jgi:hypothetical protein
MTETVTSAAWRNGYFMGYNLQEPWKNTSQDYKDGFKKGNLDKELSIETGKYLYKPTKNQEIKK